MFGPPVDQYRQPFIDPLGRMTLYAALADNLMVSVLAVAKAGSNTDATPEHFSDAALLTRHWDAKRVAQVIADSKLRADILGAISAATVKYSALKDRRNRAVHDAVELGWDAQTGLQALSMGYRKVEKDMQVHHSVIRPIDIAEIATGYYELRGDLDHCVFLIHRAEGRKAVNAPEQDQPS